MTGNHKSILITGGAGFIGCALSNELAKSAADVAVVDILHPQVHRRKAIPSRLSSNVVFYPVDVTSQTEWDAVIGILRPDCIVHLAAETGTGQSLAQATRHGLVNVVGTTQMCDAFMRNDCLPSHIVLASSRAVYGEGLWVADGQTYSPGSRRHEDLCAGRWDFLAPSGERAQPLAHCAAVVPPSPTSVYGATKLAQENILSAWTSATGTALSILRFQNVYGPGQSTTNPYTGIVTLFARLAMSGKTLDVFEDGAIIRDFVHVDDTVRALLSVIERPPITTRVLDIGSGVQTTVLELAVALAERFDAPAPSVTGAFRDGDIRSAWADISAAKMEIGYRPLWSLGEGLESLISWLETDGDEPGQTTS